MSALVVASGLLLVVSGAVGPAAEAGQSLQAVRAASENRAAAVPPPLPPDYVIGPQDVLSVVFWRDQEMSAEVIVRPDGKISLPLIQDVQAAGYTPDQLTGALEAAASKYITRPNATVIVKEINSRQVYILGQVEKPGAFPLTSDTTVLQLIAMAGDLLEYAKSKKIIIVRKERSAEQRFRFNYKDVVAGKNTGQNILLKPGDTVIVP